MTLRDPSPIGPTVALVVITLNEEPSIGRCLGSVSGLVSQTIVVDSGSSDRTRDIAEQAGARVFVREFSGYGAQKQFALEQSSCDWLLFLDADEWLDETTRDEIASALAAPPLDEVTGFRLRMQTFYLGRWMRHSAWWSEWKLRLARRGCARWKPDVVHESMELTRGRCESLPGRIRHHPYRDLNDQLETIDRYTDIIAIRDEKTAMPRILFGMIVEPPLVFLQKYVLQFGVLDGLPGFVGASLMAFYFFLRYTKIWLRRSAPG